MVRPATAPAPRPRGGRARVAPLMLLALSACASVTRTSRTDLAIVTTPAGARADLSSGDTCTTPCTLHVPRANALTVRVTKPGYVTQSVTVASKVGAGGVAALLGNGLVGGLAGLSADADDGALRSLMPNPVKVALVAAPAEPPAPVTVAPVPSIPPTP